MSEKIRQYTQKDRDVILASLQTLAHTSLEGMMTFGGAFAPPPEARDGALKRLKEEYGLNDLQIGALSTIELSRLKAPEGMDQSTNYIDVFLAASKNEKPLIEKIVDALIAIMKPDKR